MQSHKIVLILGITILLIAAAAAAFLIGSHQSDNIVRQLNEKVEKLEQTEQDAAIVRRTSEQMENIAYQQKEVSDQQRDQAEQQRQIAIEMAKRAQEESQAAQEAKSLALSKAQEAENERQLADQMRISALEQRDAVTQARSTTDTLYYRNISHSLGIQSLLAGNSSDYTQNLLTCYAAWYLSHRFKGNTYHQNIFDALQHYSETTQTLEMPKRGAVEAFAEYGSPAAHQFVVISDYGSVLLCSPNGKVKTLLEDKTYDWRGVCCLKDTLFLLSRNGVLALLTPGALKVQILHSDCGEYLGMNWLSSGILALFAHDKVVFYRTPNHSVFTIHLNQKMTSWVQTDTETLLFFANGSCASLDKSGHLKPHASYCSPKVVTATSYDPISKCIYLGGEDGSVCVYNKFGRLLENLPGHKSSVVSIAYHDGLLISGSYDHSVNVWIVRNFSMDSGHSFKEEAESPTSLAKLHTKNTHEWINPAIIKCKGWPLVLRIDGDQAFVCSSDGTITSFCISTDKMAEVVRKKLPRNLTSQEWNSLFGSNLPYEKFIEK